MLLITLMLKRPVAVVLPFQFNPLALMRLFALIFCAFLSLSPVAQVGDPLSSENVNGYVARILNDSPEEVADALERVEKLYAAGELPLGAGPISIILHGPEVEIFFKDKYDEYKKIVDLDKFLIKNSIIIYN